MVAGLDERVRAAVVSAPCFELFRQQSREYRAKVLGRAPRIGVEAAVEGDHLLVHVDRGGVEGERGAAKGERGAAKGVRSGAKGVRMLFRDSAKRCVNP